MTPRRRIRKWRAWFRKLRVKHRKQPTFIRSELRVLLFGEALTGTVLTREMFSEMMRRAWRDGRI
jgi:hypothetical protein